MDLSTQLASWKADKLRQAPTVPLLGRLEKSHNAKVERLEESRTMLPEAKQLEKSEAGRTFAADFRRMRLEIIAGYDSAIEEQRRAANPPTTNEELSRMSLLSGVHLPVWQRSPGNLVMDAAGFEQQGDVAALKFARLHVGLLAPGQRSGAAASIVSALAGHKTDAVVKAETEGRSLKLERDRFELASSMRERGIVAARAGRYRPGQRGIESAELSHDEGLDGTEAEPAEPSEAAAS
jgi:hypothetical protein